MGTVSTSASSLASHIQCLAHAGCDCRRRHVSAVGVGPANRTPTKGRTLGYTGPPHAMALKALLSDRKQLRRVVHFLVEATPVWYSELIGQRGGGGLSPEEDAVPHPPRLTSPWAVDKIHANTRDSINNGHRIGHLHRALKYRAANPPVYVRTKVNLKSSFSRGSLVVLEPSAYFSTCSLSVQASGWFFFFSTGADESLPPKSKDMDGQVNQDDVSSYLSSRPLVLTRVWPLTRFLAPFESSSVFLVSRLG